MNASSHNIFNQYVISSSFSNNIKIVNGQLAFDLGGARLDLSDLSVSADGKQTLGLGRITLEWSWSDLLENHLVLIAVTLGGIDLEVERETGRLAIAGIDLPQGSTPQEPADASRASNDETGDWRLTLQRFEVENFKLCYRALPQYDYCNSFDKLAWAGNLSLDPAQAENDIPHLQLEGNFHLDRLRVHNNRLDRDGIRMHSGCSGRGRHPSRARIQRRNRTAAGYPVVS